MSERASKRSSYWLRERNKKQTDAKKSSLEEQHKIEYLSKHEIKLGKCSFVKECGQKAKQKKIMKNAIKYSTTSKNFSYPSVFKIFKYYVKKIYKIHKNN